VRIANFAILYILLALGLNIVVGFAGLLDLGYRRLLRGRCLHLRGCSPARISIFICPSG